MGSRLSSSTNPSRTSEPTKVSEVGGQRARPTQRIDFSRQFQVYPDIICDMSDSSLDVYRSCKPVVDAEYTSESDRSPSDAVIEALAKAAETDPIELPPLYEFIDPDALDQLIEKHGRASSQKTVLSFQVETWNVFINSDGQIRVCDSTHATPPEPVFDSITA